MQQSGRFSTEQHQREMLVTLLNRKDSPGAFWRGKNNDLLEWWERFRLEPKPDSKPHTL